LKNGWQSGYNYEKKNLGKRWFILKEENNMQSAEEAMIARLENYKIFLTGHFLLSSGRHSGQYINKDAIYCIPGLFSWLVRKFASILDNDFESTGYTIITGPAIAGTVLAAPIAIKLNKIFVYPEKGVRSEFKEYPIGQIVKSNVMEFRRGYNKIIEGEKVVIVEDIITTGASVQKTIDAIKHCGGECVGILSIWNRGTWAKGIKMVSLVNKFIESWPANNCPLCKNNIPLTDPKN
jgi:orotate phosphoribosyltransferase